MTPELWQRVCGALDWLEANPQAEQQTEYFQKISATDPEAAQVVQNLWCVRHHPNLDRFDRLSDSMRAQLQTHWSKMFESSIDDRAGMTTDTHLDSARILDPTVTEDQQNQKDHKTINLPKEARTLPYQFGDYELLEEIARGGMGAVYRARQSKLDRIVAVKLLLNDSLQSEERIQRFYREAQAAGRLQHPNIVPVFDVGEVDGQHFYSMEFVAGQSLAYILLRKRLTTEQILEFMLPMVSAVQFAHENNILHRDLKPANILIDAKGKPRVTDFGLARRLDSGSGLTSYGRVLGTPAYMPPEQALGKHDQVTVRSDIYSLGAILYQMLCGKLPFKGDSHLQTLRLVLEQPPKAPRLHDPNVHPELEAICLKCLEKDPANRYDSAEQLLAELQRVQRQEPTQAATAARTQRLSRLQRFWASASLSICVALFLLYIGWQKFGYTQTITAHQTLATPSNEKPETITTQKQEEQFGETRTPAPSPSDKSNQQTSEPVRTEIPHVRQFEITHLSYRSNRLIYRGPLHRDFKVRLHDEVYFQVGLDNPGYCYLVALNPDGSETLCYPEIDSVAPPQAAQWRYPQDKNVVFSFTEGVGQQAFVLIVAAAPLPSYRDWLTQRGQLDWSGQDLGYWSPEIIPHRQLETADKLDEDTDRGKSKSKSIDTEIVRVEMQIRSTLPVPVAVYPLAFPIEPNH